MAKSKSEVGHAKNVENFADLIAFCTGYGATYHPTKEAITITALNTLLTSAQQSLSEINSTAPAWINAVNARQQAFAQLSTLATRILNALDASDVHDDIVEDAKTFVRKLQGRRAAPKTAPDPENPNGKTASVSQMSFDQRIENFDGLINLLESVPAYNPNEVDLKTETLRTMLTEMKATNTAVTEALVPLSNARLGRNKILYSPTEGLVHIASEVKKYVKSVYGASAPEFKQVSGLKFTYAKL